MNDSLEIKPTPSRPMPMSSHEENLMQQHLRDENLPEAVMPACPVNKVLKGQKALVTGANSGIGQAVALALARAGAWPMPELAPVTSAFWPLRTLLTGQAGITASGRFSSRRCCCMRFSSCD